MNYAPSGLMLHNVSNVHVSLQQISTIPASLYHLHGGCILSPSQRQLRTYSGRTTRLQNTYMCIFQRRRLLNHTLDVGRGAFQATNLASQAHRQRSHLISNTSFFLMTILTTGSLGRRYSRTLHVCEMTSMGTKQGSLTKMQQRSGRIHFY
jgi:hypothetical protein